MNPTIRHTSLSIIALAVVSLAMACTSEKIVYRSGADFAAPATNAANFIGYYDDANKQTICGSCHVDFQVRWKQSAHANAWADLQANSHATGSCNGCHTVGSLGNAVTDTASGYRSTKDARYHDVQCESCHGPGLTHATSPVATNRPLASIRSDSAGTNGCGECHAGSHHPFVEEWQKSGHNQSMETAHNSTEADCRGCHSAQGALAKWGKAGNYVEKTSATMLDVNCVTCHDPHMTDNPAQLRFSISAADLEENLCVKCHQRRGAVSEVTTRNSTHAPEGPVFFGTAGWLAPGMPPSGSLLGTHADPKKNPTLCAGCHVQTYAGTDPITKAAINSTGHLFFPTPCLGPNGVPTADQTGCTDDMRSFKGCTASGCHGTEAAARSSFITAETRAASLIAQANAVVAAAKLTAKGSECTFASTKPYSSCMGLQFNTSIASRAGAFVHNPFLMEQLMINSITKVKADYGVTMANSVDMNPIFRKGTPIGEGGR